MRIPQRLQSAVFSATLANAAIVAVATSAPVNAAAFPLAGTTMASQSIQSPHVAQVTKYSLTWGVIGRNTFGSPVAQIRFGPYGRTSISAKATQPPPYGAGSLGLEVTATEKVAYGNETDFGGIPLAQINQLNYWVFAGVDSLAGVSLPGVNMEVDPKLPSQPSYTSLVYLPKNSTSPSAPSTPLPNVWQHYDATATGNRWFATGAVGTAIGCTLTTPCTFAALKSMLPNAVISYSLGITKGPDNAFVGAVDGLQVNNTIYNFDPIT
jgi:hypothetical protein